MAQFKRRHFLIASGAMLASRLAHGQGAVRKVGILSASRPPSAEEIASNPFFAKLRQLGWIEGQNLLIVRAYADLNVGRLPSLAQDLVRQSVDVIAAFGLEPPVEAARATVTIPIVFGFFPWPVEMGLVESFAKPGRNATGMASYTGLEVSNKRHEFLREIAPAAKRLSWIEAPQHRQGSAKVSIDQGAGAALGRLGYETKWHMVEKPEDLERAFSEIVAFRAQALSVAGNAVLNDVQQKIADFALKRRIPSASILPKFADAGGLLSYATSGEPKSTFERCAEYVDRILRGARPADLPVEQPSRYELAINLKTAKALGLKVPSSLLLRTDRVIE